MPYLFRLMFNNWGIIYKTKDNNAQIKSQPLYNDRPIGMFFTNL